MRGATADLSFGDGAFDRIWDMVDGAERYLVSGMFEQATSLAFSIAKSTHNVSPDEDVEGEDVSELVDVPGMILVQSLKELGRTSELFAQLTDMYGAIGFIPVQVFITGASMQIATRCGSELSVTFPQYLSKWKYTENCQYVTKETSHISLNHLLETRSMTAEEYFKLAELYTISFLGGVVQDFDSAISWIEEAQLAEQDREKLLLKLGSLKAAEKSSSSTDLDKKKVSDRSLPAAALPVKPDSMVKGSKLNGSVLNIHQSSLRFWWFHSVRLKIGSRHIIVPSGKFMILLSLIISALFILRKRSTSLKRMAAARITSVRNALLDALQLAFSVHMNPLAAVQQVPYAPRASL